jgi:FkbM family methyltransferase
LLNGRPLSMVSRNLFAPSNYAAAIRAARVYEQPIQALGRYILGRGTYPCSVRLQTSMGPQEVTLFCSHDAITVHEIFCRRDYWFPVPPRVVVDVGSNIGVSALYFLTRSPAAYCDLYEPDPRNIERLQHNLAPFRGRFTLHQTAVADRAGELPFSREPTGRYGSLDPAPWVRTQEDTVTVQVEHINTALERALSRSGTIDLLKIDTESSELATVQAIDPAMRQRIRHIVIESHDHRIKIAGFRTDSQCDAVRFTNKELSTSEV